MSDFIKSTFHRLIDDLDIKTHRYLFDEFNIKNRLTGLVGPRGVGKTTLMLQYIKQKLTAKEKPFYFSADNVYFNNASLVEFIANLYHTDGIKVFFIDEIHKYENWHQELKNIYDSFPEIKLIFSGSSSIDLVKGSFDLSRRAKLFRLPGLSFREYINFSTGANLKPIVFKGIINNYADYDRELSQIPRVKGLFQQYLKAGYFPFVFEDESSYYEKVLRIIEKVIYEDITNFYNLKTANLHYFKRILNFFATSEPGNISINNIANNLGIDHKTVAYYLQILSETCLIKLIYAAVTGSKVLRKPEKAFLHNTTFLNALLSISAPVLQVGAERELFFAQALTDAGLNVFYSPIGDFAVDDIVFEIGGKNKTRQQLKNLNNPKSLLVKDNILTSENGAIPLYYFGFLY